MDVPPKVVFETENELYLMQRPRERAIPGMAGWLIRNFNGVAKSEKEASFILAVAAILIFALSIVIAISAVRDGAKEPGNTKIPIPAGPGDPRFYP